MATSAAESRTDGALCRAVSTVTTPSAEPASCTWRTTADDDVDDVDDVDDADDGGGDGGGRDDGADVDDGGDGCDEGTCTSFPSPGLIGMATQR